MRIRDAQRRLPELGRIRLGTKGPKGQPQKGEHLRFTSNDRAVLDQVAELYGGTVTDWPKGEQAYQLQSERATVPVFLPADPLDTAYERWGSGGCQRRCDGETCTVPQMDDQGGRLVEEPCWCARNGLTPGERNSDACAVTVRVRVVLAEVTGVGHWMTTSHSIYAALELPGQVDVIEQVRRSGQLIPCDFGIERRSEKKPYEKYKREYIVPVLRVRATLAEIAGAAASGASMLTAGDPAGNGDAVAAQAALPPAVRPEVLIGAGEREALLAAVSGLSDDERKALQERVRGKVPALTSERFTTDHATIVRDELALVTPGGEPF